jgi:cobyrinic acid a,c-diamide synthase
MFHGRVIGTKSRNLDTFFTDAKTTRYLFAKNAGDCDLAVAEGVMGYYDGLGGISTKGSTYEVATTLDLPVVLIVGCKGASLSILATIKGFLEYRKDSHIRGVILNQVSPMIYGQLKPLIEQELGITVLGYVPPVPELALESRHLGLVLPGEIEALQEKLNRLAAVLEETLDLDRLIELARSSEELPEEKLEDADLPQVKGICIGVAQDDAFCFTYLDNLELLKEMGAELVPFSPLSDPELPEGLSGLILSGGYPELHAEALSANSSMRDSIRKAIRQGMPCIAECGGFLYLHRELEGDDGKDYPMAGVIDGKAYRTPKLGRFGYITLEAKEDQLLGKAGTKIRGHEFHYWDSTCCGESFHAVKPTGKRNWDCVCGSETLYAGFPHLFFYSNREAAGEFLRKCEDYKVC